MHALPHISYNNTDEDYPPDSKANQCDPMLFGLGEIGKYKVNKAIPLQDYPGKSKLLLYQAAALDLFFDKFFYLEDIFATGNVILYWSHINEIIANQYLANDHVDAFAIILCCKSAAKPWVYKIFLYVSPMLWDIGYAFGIAFGNIAEKSRESQCRNGREKDLELWSSWLECWLSSATIRPSHLVSLVESWSAG